MGTPSSSSKLANRQQAVLKRIADKLSGFRVDAPTVVYNYQNPSDEDTIAFRAALRRPGADQKLASLLPTELKTRFLVEKALAYQFLVALDKNDIDGANFWESTLKVYTPRPLEVITGSQGFGTLVGMEQIKQRLRKRVLLPYLANDDTVPGFLLFDGPPGGGKTVSAKRLSEELGYRYLETSLGELNQDPNDHGSASYGDIAHNLHRIVQDAMQQGPCVLFLDEFSAIAKVREGSSNKNDVGMTTDSILQDLNALKEFNARPENRQRRVLVVAATNHKEDIDPAILSRALRLHFPAPSRSQVKAISFKLLKDTFRKHGIEPEIPLETMASQIAEAFPSDTRKIESIVLGVTHTAKYENDKLATASMLTEEIQAALHEDSVQDIPQEDEWMKLIENDFPLVGLSSTGTSDKAMLDRKLPDETLLDKKPARKKTISELIAMNAGVITLALGGTVSLLAVSGLLPGSSFFIFPMLPHIHSFIQKIPDLKSRQALTNEIHNIENTVKAANGPEKDETKTYFGSSKPSKGRSTQRQHNSQRQVANTFSDITEKIKALSQEHQHDSVFSITESILDKLVLLTRNLNENDTADQIAKVREWLRGYNEYINLLPEGVKTFREVPFETRKKYRVLIFNALSSNVDLLVNWGKSEARRLGYPDENIKEIILLSKRQNR